MTPKLLAAARNLRWLQAPAAAPPAGYYFPELIAHPMVVTNFREVYNDHLAHHILALMLALAKRLHHYHDRQRERRWQPLGGAAGGQIFLPDATALIVGLGGAGTEAARLCRALGMRVVAVDARRTERPPGVDELYPPQALDGVLGDADFVILTIPHTPQTEGLFNADRFRLMKESAILINIGRGMTTRLDDLNAALRAGQIGGAGLDVFELEPLPPDHHAARRRGRGALTWMNAATRLCATTCNGSAPAARCATWWTRRSGSKRSCSSAHTRDRGDRASGRVVREVADQFAYGAGPGAVRVDAEVGVPVAARLPVAAEVDQRLGQVAVGVSVVRFHAQRPPVGVDRLVQPAGIG